jgi:hypothetical protein
MNSNKMRGGEQQTKIAFPKVRVNPFQARWERGWRNSKVEEYVDEYIK